jgi:hypothetical protein
MPRLTPETRLKREIKAYLDALALRFRAEGKHLFHFHIRQSLGSYPGLPDLMVVLDGKVYAVEVKSRRGKLTKKQKEFQEKWEMAGCTYILAKSVDDIALYIAPAILEE